MTDIKFNNEVISEDEIKECNYSYNFHISHYYNIDIFEYYQPIKMFQDTLFLLKKYEKLSKSENKMIDLLFRSHSIDDTKYEQFENDLKLIMTCSEEIKNNINLYFSEKYFKNDESFNIIRMKKMWNLRPKIFYILNNCLTKYFDEKSKLFYEKEDRFKFDKFTVILTCDLDIEQYKIGYDNPCITVSINIIEQQSYWGSGYSDYFFNLIKNNHFGYNKIEDAHKYYDEIYQKLSELLPKIPIAPNAPFPNSNS